MTNLNWKHLYSTTRWRNLRAAVLREHPLCQRHLRFSPPRYVPATVVHHLEPHRGDRDKFFGGPLEALCKACHDGAVQAAEARGLAYDEDINASGLPVDPAHPFMRGC